MTLPSLASLVNRFLSFVQIIIVFIATATATLSYFVDTLRMYKDANENVIIQASATPERWCIMSPMFGSGVATDSI